MTTLKERIGADLNEAMRARDALKTGALRLLKAGIANKEVELKVGSLDDAGVLAVVGAQAKQRRDAANQYREAGRPDLAGGEEAELAVLLAYLPRQLSAGELAAEVGKIVAEVGAKGPKDVGAVMKACARLRGLAEGKALSDEVKKQLAAL